MAYLDDILKGTRKVNNNVQTLGSYSPLTGFSNEYELSKNPYQQILSSLPKENTTSSYSPFSNDYLKSFNMNNTNSSNIPDGINIDSTFYNRKDIYDLQQRLKASGIDIPDGTKDSPGIITRFFDILSTPGYAVTTAVYNALDGDDDTKVLKGLVDGIVGGLTSNDDKYKEGSDLIDLAFGERTGDEGFLEKTGRFLGGVLLDTALDPTSYLTFGVPALVNGATKQVGEEVTEQAVKNAIKGVNEVGELAKAGKMLNLDDQAKRIAKQINENAVKKRSGMVFEIPFTKIEKEIISAEKISEIGKKLGLQDTIGKAIDKGGDLVKGAWNLKKSDDGIRASLEKLPEAIGRKFDTDYDLKKLMKSDPLKASEQIASKEIKNLLSVRKEEVLEEAYKGVKELIELMNDNGIDSKEASSLLEKLETHNIEKELTPESMLKMIDDSFLGVTNIGLENSTKAMNNAEIEMRKRMRELLQGKVIELENLEKVDNLLKQNGIEVSTKASIEEKKKLIEEVEKSKLPTYEELGIKQSESNFTNEVKTKNNYETEWEVYADTSRKEIETIMKEYNLSGNDIDELLNMTGKDFKNYFDNVHSKSFNEQYQKRYNELIKTRDLNETEINKIVNDHFARTDKTVTKTNNVTKVELNKAIESEIKAKRLEGKDFRFIDGSYKKAKQSSQSIDKIKSLKQKIKKIEDNLYDYQLDTKSIFGAKGFSEQSLNDFLKYKNECNKQIADLKKQIKDISNNVEYVDLTKSEIKEIMKSYKQNSAKKIKRVSAKDLSSEEINSIIEKELKNGSLKDIDFIDGVYKKKYIDKDSLDKLNNINIKNSNFRTKLEDIRKSYKVDKNNLLKSNNVETKVYKTATTQEELMSKIDDYINNDAQKNLDKYNNINKNSEYVDLTPENLKKEAQEIADNFFGLDEDLTKDRLTSKEYFMKEYIKASSEGKLNPDNTMLQNWNELHRSKINEQIINMLDIRDNVLRNSGYLGNKGKEQILDKLIENKVMNMLNPKSEYFTSPYKVISTKTLTDELVKLVDGKANGVRINNYFSLSDLARKMDSLYPGEYERFINGTSELFKGDLAQIYGLRSQFNNSVSGKLRTETINSIKNILHGRGIDASSSKIFDEAIRFRKRNSDVEMKLSDVLQNLNKGRKQKGLELYTLDNLPKSFLDEWEQISDGGLIQQAEQILRREFGEKYKDVKFFDLTKEERQDLLKRTRKIAEDLTGTEHFAGNYDALTGQNITNYNDLIKVSESAYDTYNGKPLREKRTYTNQEYLNAINDSETLSKEVNSALKGDNGIRSMQNTPKKGGMLEDLKLKAQNDLELMEQILQDSDISYQDSNKLKKLIKQRKTDIKAIDKEIDIYNEFINSTEKFGQEFKNDRILNSEITGRNKELDLSELGTKTELNKKQEFIEKRLKELDDIDKSNLTDAQKQAIKNERLELQKQNKQLWDKKNKDFDKNSIGRNTVMNTKSWGQPDKTVNVNDIFDDNVKPKYKSQKAQDIVKELQDGYKARRRMIAYDSAKNSAEFETAVSKELPNGVKLEKVVGNEGAVQKVIDNVNSRNINKMNVKELKQMLSDAGVKGISKSNRAELVEIANLINSKNIRASIDLSKKTPEEMQRLLKQLGIKDADFDRAVQRFTGAKNQVDKYKASKDAIEGVWKDNNISKFTNTMENLFGEAFINKWNVGIDNLNAKADNFKVTGRVAKTPIELIADNKEVIEALGGGEKAEEFVQKYVKLMQDFGQDEISWGIFTGDENLIKSQGYVARRMSDETREILNGDVDKNNFLEAWFRDRRNMIYDDPKFAKQRSGEFKTNIAEINEAIYKATKEKFGEEGAIENFFERDLSRILIQRAYEHGNAFYDKNLQTMYLGKMGVQMSWAKGKNGAYNIVESVNGAKWNKILSDGTTLNELQTFMKSQDYESLRKEIKNFLPNDSYIPDAKLQKVIDNSLESLDRLENYLKAGAPNKKKLRELRNDVFANLPQRGFARELQAGVKNGDIKLIYPSGQSRELTVNAIKEDSVKKILNKDLMKNDFVDHSDFTELSWKDFEKISATTNEVPVYAVNKQVYEAYQKAMTEQLVKDKDNFLQVYDKFMGYWKKMATTSVGFHTRNFFGNQFQMYLDVGSEAMNPKWLKIAKQVSDDSTDVLFKAVDGTEYTGKMVNDLFKKVGLDDVTQMNSEFNKARKGKLSIDELLNGVTNKPKNPIEAIFDKSQEVGDYIEKMAKRQQFSILLEKGYDPLEAKRHVDKFLFDYNDLTDFETDFMKRIIPFYTFAKKNLGLQIDTIMNNPTPVKTVRRMLDNQRKVNVSAEEERLITDNDNDKIILDFGGKKRTISTNLPWVQDTNILGAITPLIKTPLEMATNKNFTFGTEIESYEGQMKEASPLEGILGGLLGQTEIGADGKKYINAKAKHLITNALPSVRTMDRSFENVTGDDKLGGLMAFLGLGGQEFSTEKRTSYEVREYKELLENLEKKAQSMGINTREELKKKQQLEALLQQLGVR